MISSLVARALEMPGATASMFAHGGYGIPLAGIAVAFGEVWMRVGPSELFGLKWPDVDFDNKAIHPMTYAMPLPRKLLLPGLTLER